MSRLYRAIRALAEKGDRAVIASCSGLVSAGIYGVTVSGASYEVPAIGGASAGPRQAVAVLVSGETGKPIGMLGVVSP
ncbi:MAG: hypothetical protein ACE149_16495 [Armatimonadota bacterium]